jgi:hypothetical protein
MKPLSMLKCCGNGDDDVSLAKKLGRRLKGQLWGHLEIRRSEKRSDFKPLGTIFGSRRLHQLFSISYDHPIARAKLSAAGLARSRDRYACIDG